VSRRRGPPTLAVRFLRRFLPPGLRDFVEGDLLERYEAYARTSRLRADLWFWRQVAAAALTRLPGPMGVDGAVTFSGFGRDLVRVLRGLVRNPGHSLVAILTLGLGIGVVGTAFTILNATVLRGLPFEEADRLVHFERARPDEGVFSLAVTPHDYLAWREAQSSFEGLGAYVEASAVLPSDGGPPERYLGVRISANAFSLLRVAPARGRGFSEDDERLGAPEVVVLSHLLWQSRFGGDPDIVGREVRMNDTPTTVVGVMPEGFGFPIAERFWLPLRLDLEGTLRGQGRLDVFGRLSDGVAFEAAVAEFERICRGLEEAYPATNGGVEASMRSFHDEYVGEEFTRTAVRMLIGALLVLFVCCANVANLLLIRGSRKRRSLALRVSLGATRARIVRELLTEAMTLTVLGAVLGIGLAWYGVAWFDRAGAQAGVFDLPHGSDSLFWWDLRLDARTMAVVLAVTCVTAVVAGVVPALRSSAAASGGALTVRSPGSSTGSGRLSDGLAVVQMALATSLVLLAGLVTRSGLNVAAADDAIVSDGAYVTTVDVPSGSYGDDASRLQLAERLIEHFAGRPEVAEVAIASRLPLALPPAASLHFEGRDGADDTGVVSASPEYLSAFGVDVVDGRWFDDRDRSGAEPVAVVNQSFASRYLASGTVLGTRFRLGDPDGLEPWVTVVGVVPDLWDQPLQPQREAGVYLPLSQSGMGDPAVRLGRLGLRYQTLVVRVRPGTDNTSDLVRAGVYEVDRALPVRALESMNEVVQRQMGRYRVWGRFYTAFALVGLLLAAMGVYGVLSFGVSHRTTEIGVRRALGATGASVQGHVLARAGRQIAIGVAIGLLAGMGMADGLARVLYGVDPGDPLVLALVPVVMVVVGLAASWLPARRASSVDPMVAIQE